MERSANNGGGVAAAAAGHTNLPTNSGDESTAAGGADVPFQAQPDEVDEDKGPEAKEGPNPPALQNEAEPSEETPQVQGDERAQENAVDIASAVAEEEGSAGANPEIDAGEASSVSDGKIDGKEGHDQGTEAVEVVVVETETAASMEPEAVVMVTETVEESEEANTDGATEIAGQDTQAETISQTVMLRARRSHNCRNRPLLKARSQTRLQPSQLIWPLTPSCPRMLRIRNEILLRATGEEQENVSRGLSRGSKREGPSERW